jgi:response regulator RpfG family c-di-GMP phosphodiesterase/HAMP domain-containing protein
MSIPWRHSIHTQMALALALIFALLVGTLGYTLYALRLRQHDYIILNLTGQLRVLSQTMLDQAQQYRSQAPDDHEKYNRDLVTYWQGLQKQTKQYDEIIQSLKTRQLSVAGKQESAVKHGKIYCTFDAFSRSQLSRSATDWQRFETGLKQELGADTNAPRLTWAAEYIVNHGDSLVASSENLANAFQTMMESKLNEIKWFLMLAAGLGTLLLLGILAMLRHEVLKPIKATLKGFNQVAQGDFSHPVPVKGQNEIAQMGSAFNQLTNRLNAMFRLTNRINQSTQLDEVLEFVYSEFKHFVPLDWVAVLFATPDGRGVNLERCYSDKKMMFTLGQAFKLPTQLKSNANAAVHMQFNPSNMPAANTIEHALTQNDLKSALILPMQNNNAEAVHTYMVFASKNKAYQPDHIAFLSNIGAVISHVFEKTVVMENLVVAAIKGLAKLAESRDPETGDHLTRMALYSAIVAEELSHHPAYSAIITPAYVRDLFNFAPMHDIGKVGIADSILLKPGKLDTEERAEMERHPTIGAEVLQLAESQVAAHGRSLFKIGIEIAAAHHEKFDGTGYPAQLKGNQIPLSARIVAAADVFDALTSKRPYKEAWSVQKALDFMNEGAGQHFDPEIVNALNRALPRVLEVYERLKHV